MIDIGQFFSKLLISTFRRTAGNMAKREIYAKEILNDIRSGMSYSNLMTKYK